MSLSVVDFVYPTLVSLIWGLTNPLLRILLVKSSNENEVKLKKANPKDGLLGDLMLLLRWEVRN